jgi:hypothetical protein
MATREQAKRRNLRLRQKVEQSESGGNRTRERNKKDKAVSEVIFSAPVRDADWKPLPFGDATVPDRELPAAKDRAVHAMGEWGVLVESSRESGLGRWVLQRLMKSDETFRLRMVHAKRNCMERIEREMIRRGQLKGGDLAGIFVTKHNIPKYREVQRVELTGKGGGPVGYVDMKAELLKRIESIALKQNAGQIAVGEKGPRLLKGGSDAEGVKGVRKVESQGYEIKSRK